MEDCHIHIAADGVSYRDAMVRHVQKPDELHIRQVFESLCAHDVSFVRDGGDKFGVSLRAREIAPEFNITYLTPGWIVYHEGYYGSAYGRPYRDIAEYREMLSVLKGLNVDFIKLAATGMLDFDVDGHIIGEPLPQDELRETIHIAHSEGYKIMIHTNGAEAIKRLTDAVGDSGAAVSIEHGFWADPDSVRSMKDAGIIWVPTCVTVANNLGGERYPAKVMQKILDNHAENLIYANSIGVKIAVGSDSGAYNVFHGSAAAQEYAFLRELGINTHCINA